MASTSGPVIRHLLIVQDSLGRHTYSLTEAAYTLGRDGDNTIVLRDRSVSRHHALLMRFPGEQPGQCRFQIVDGDLKGQRSTNGIFVNGQRHLSQDLCHGDLIEFGAGRIQANYCALANLSDTEFEVIQANENPLTAIESLGDIHRTVYRSLASDDQRESNLIRLASFPELSPTPMLELDWSGHLTYLNLAATRQFPDLQDYQAQHPLIAPLLVSARLPNQPDQFRQIVELSHDSNGELHGEQDQQVGDRVFEATVHLIRGSELIRIFAVEITERYRAEAELRQTVELLRQREAQLQELDRLKDEFLANTSHELRTPLTGMTGLAESMLDGVAGQLTPVQTQNLQLIMQSSHRLSNLVNDLLDFAKLRHEPSNLQRTAIDLRAIVEVVLQLSRGLNRDKQLTLINAIPAELPPVYADVNRLQQILHNLVGNAIKFTEQGAITVSASLYDAPVEQVNVIDATTKASSRFKNTHDRRLKKSTPSDYAADLPSKSAHTTQGSDTQASNNQAIQPQPTKLQLTQLQPQVALTAESGQNHTPGPTTSQLVPAAERSSKEKLPGPQIRIEVHDTGIGIAPDRLDRIFQSFEQGDGSVARQFGGTGLGLAISRQLVEQHQGQIWVESTVGVGSRFHFTLPIATVPIGATTQVVSQPALPLCHPAFQVSKLLTHLPPVQPLQTPAQTAHILVVDDEPINLQVLHNYLTVSGYQVTTVNSGQAALDLLESAQPQTIDLVLLDVMMPHMSGYEVCQRLRDRFPLQQLPVVMLTAKNQVADLVTAFESGANDYLVKPFIKSELLARIKTHLQLAKIACSYQRFVPYEYLHFLGKESILDVSLGDHISKTMTVMFSDIRDFTDRKSVV